MKASQIVVGMVSLGVMACSSPKPEPTIDRTYIEKFITELSSDALRGRKAGTPDADKAAALIEAQFKAAGLVSFNNLPDYFQTFSMLEVVPGEQTLELDGKKFDNSDFFVIGVSDSFSSSDMANFQTSAIGPDENMQDTYSKVIKGTSAQLVLVHSSQKDMFARYRNYFMRSKFMMKQEALNPLVWVLTDAVSAKKINVAAKNIIKTASMKNVIGVLPGNTMKDEYVLFTAHYDHIGVLTSVEGDSIANGADDDASGVTALVTLANYFAQLKTNERTLVFAACTAEEVGAFGSEYLASTLDAGKCVANINIEMVGKPSKFGPNASFITGFDKSDLGKILQEASVGKSYSFHPDPYPDQNLFYRSDNINFAKLGIPAHTVSTDQIDIDSLYHTVNDELSSLDLAHLTQITTGLAEAVKPIILGKRTPTRITEKIE